MPIDQELLDMLVCPESREKLSLADSALITKINARIASGEISNRAGQTVKQSVESGLTRPDGKFLYPVRDEIPNLLVDEAIPLDQLT